MSLKEAEAKDKYIFLIENSYINKEARNSCIYKEDTQSYIKDKILNYIKKYPIFNDVSIVILDPSAENGYPHTRPNNIICIPSNSSFPELEATLFHEVVHIHQRNNKIIWDNFLSRHGWEPFEANKVPERWREKCRLNPDTVYCQYYIFENRYVPLPMFIKETNLQLHDVKVMWYDIKTGALNHSPPVSFLNKYGDNVRQSEHPFEIYAVLLSEMYPFSDRDIFNYLIDGHNRFK